MKACISDKHDVLACLGIYLLKYRVPLKCLPSSALQRYTPSYFEFWTPKLPTSIAGTVVYIVNEIPHDSTLVSGFKKLGTGKILNF
jgi:hypothetical protein